MRRKIYKKGVCLFLSIVLVLTMAGCGSESSTDQRENYAQGEGGYSDSTVRLSVDDGVPASLGDGFCFVGEEQGLTDFSVRLFQAGFQAEESMMVSPLSLMTALAMTARGAEGETLEQIETALDSDLDYFTAYLGTFLESLTGRESKFTSANSVWIRDDEDRVQVNEQFVVDADAYFHADIFKAAFDMGTVKDINRWCSEKTDGMIPELLKEIRDDEIMHLINAICFDAKWQSPYESWNVSEGDFYNREGGKDRTDFMYGSEYQYLEDASMTGFIKPYRDGFSFVALVPKAGVLMVCGTEDNPGCAETYGAYTGEFTAEALTEYVQKMTGDSLRTLLENSQSVEVRTKMPAFTSEYSINLIPALESMGIRNLFREDAADLSGMASSAYGNVFISKVFQKTFIEVDTEGTRAAAVTDIAASDSAAMEIPEYKEVHLDRPFLYMIVDDETGVPIFMGTVMGL